MDFDLNFERNGTGVPFIFQHGLASHGGQPQRLLAGLSGVELISMDCPGHGKSRLSPGEPPSFASYTDHIVRLMDFLQIEQAVWGGISMGAGISINAALRYPDRVKALVLVRPAWLDCASPENLRILLEAAELIPQADGRAQFEQTKTFQQIRETIPRAAASILGVFANTQNPQLPQVLKNMVMDHPFQKLERLTEIDKPCLMIANEDDPLHPLEIGKSIQQCLPGSKLVKVASRYINDVEHRDQVLAAVREFIVCE